MSIYTSSITREIHKCSYGALLVFSFLISIYRVLVGSYIPSQGLFNYWYIRTIINIRFLRENPSRKFSLRGDSLSSRQESNIGMRFTCCIFLISNFRSFCDLFMDFLNPISACHLPDTLYNETSYIHHTWDWSHSKPFFEPSHFIVLLVMTHKYPNSRFMTYI